MTTTLDYRIEYSEDEYAIRIAAVDSGNREIVGAYRPRALNDWRMYLAKPLSESVDLPQPHKVHVVSRQDAVRWLDVLASLYMKAVST